jgi:hypothetical protein
MAYTEKTAELDPIVQVAVSAACRDATGPLQTMQAKSHAAIELATKAALLAADESAAALSIEINALIRAQTHAAATEIAHAFAALRESKTDTLAEPEDDLPPFREPQAYCKGSGVWPYGALHDIIFPAALPRVTPISAPLSVAVWPYNAQRHSPHISQSVFECQAWDVYGDCGVWEYVRDGMGMTPICARTPFTRGDCRGEIVYRHMFPEVGMRPKLTREYQEIMWAVAQKMDASFLRPIFDKYNPRAAQHVALQARERVVDDRETAVAARERDADEKAAAAAVWEAGVVLAAKAEATKAADHAHAGHLAAIAFRETELSRRARELDARDAKHAEDCVAHKARADLERAGLAAQSQAVTMRLRAAISEETDRLLTAAILQRADTLQAAVREIAREICIDALAPVEYGARLLAALGENED